MTETYDELSSRRARRSAGANRAATPDAQAGAIIDNPPVLGELGGDCLCGRGQAIGTCVVTATRLLFRAFHEPPAAYHLGHVTDWVCVDCLADAAMDVANGVVRERMRESARQRGAEMDALMRRNEIRRQAGLPLEWIDPDPEGNAWPVGGGR